MEHQRLLAIMATPFEVAPMVDRRRWPVHVTLVGNFHIDCGQEDAMSTHVAAVATDVQPFEVALGSVAHFGAAHKIPVLLAEHSALHRLHASFAERLKHRSGFLAVEPAFWGTDTARTPPSGPRLARLKARH